MNRNTSQALWTTVLVLSIIGAINWGLVGFFNWNLVDAIFGGEAVSITSVASRVVYAIVGLAGLALAAMAANRSREHAAPARHGATASTAV